MRPLNTTLLHCAQLTSLPSRPSLTPSPLTSRLQYANEQRMEQQKHHTSPLRFINPVLQGTRLVLECM